MRMAQLHDITIESEISNFKYNCELGEMKIGIVNTPSLGDSRGMQQDRENVKENVRKIIAALQGEDFINCVCFIVHGRQCRMSDTLKYVMSEVTTILPRDNIVVVFTNVATDSLALRFDISAFAGVIWAYQKLLH